MGDRANIHVHDGERPGVYLYTHWAGTELPEIVRAGLARGKSRWDDDQYLARILFCELLAAAAYDGALPDTTGFGITAAAYDGADRIVDVDTATLQVTVTAYGKTSGPTSMEQYVQLSPAEWAKG